MKKLNYLLVIMALCASLSMFTSCSDDKDETENIQPQEGSSISGDITENMILKSGKTYNLSGGVHVKEPATLTIEEGVKINCIHASESGATAYLLVEPGAKINAIGTASSPIVFTSDVHERGAWGGIIINGKAPINVSGGTAISECGDVTYGGDIANDNSGVLKYIRLEYTGYQITSEKEHNGFSFNGVGSGTTIEYLQVYKGSDDGFEWFGGTVNAKHLVSTGCGDDCFDWTFGWAGKGQFFIAAQDADAGDAGFESDNSENAHDANPFSNPTISNVTLVGKGTSRGLRLRRGTKGKFFNFIVNNFDKATQIEDDQTITNLNDGSLDIDYSVFLNCASGFAYSTGATELFENSENIFTSGVSLTDTYYGSKAGGKDLSTEDSWFTSTDYIGAVKADNDWTAGWTKK